LEPGPKTVKGVSTEHAGSELRSHGPAEKKGYFFLVVDFLVDFFAVDFLAAAFFAMALYLLSGRQI
jgi:hypothetical protein